MYKKLTLLMVALCLALLASPALAAEILFLSGNKLQCKVLSKDDKAVKVEVVVDGKPVTRTYQLTLIQTVTINDKVYVINEKPAAGTSSKTSAAPKSDEPAPTNAARRTKAEIEALIEKVGREPPDWFDSTTLDALPPGLDLTWPEKPEGGWNNQKNVGQYVWDVINPNPNKWNEGIKLMHKLLEMHQADAKKRHRAMVDIGRMYHDLHEDYARAAFWWRKAGLDVAKSTDQRHTIALAGCYYRLGNKQMAVELINKQATHSAWAAKLWADMGEMPKAVAVADAFIAQKVAGADLVLLHVADGYRQAGRAKDAAAWYERVVKLDDGNDPKRYQRSKDRARASLEAIKLFELTDAKRVADGRYEAESLGYEGPVKVAVTVAAGKITDVKVTQHREKQFYSALTDTPAKIIAKQGVKGVDATTSATITSEAIINASAKALASGAK